MTTEQNPSSAFEPQGPMSAAPQGAAPQGANAPGQNGNQGQNGGQGQGHRRRRRRRNKGGGQAGKPHPATINAQASSGDGAAPQGQSAAAPVPQNQPAPRQPGQNHGGQGKQKAGKRFFQKTPGNTSQGGGFNGNGFGRPSPGNQSSNGVGARRKNKGRRQQTFVGPMDHSYRGGANGNVADPITHSSNGDFRGMPHSGFYSEVDYYQPVAIREDAPTKIYCFIEDLFLAAKIQEVSKKLGIKVAFLKPEKEVVAKLVETDEENRPSLILFDLNNLNAKPLTLIPKIKTKLKRGTSIIGFLSQIQGELKSKALEAGCDTVMPRATFSQNLPNLLRRYGSPEEEQQGEMETMRA
jgi:hypothetical protein